MTIYLDHFFEDGTIQQVGTVSRLIVPHENLTIVNSGDIGGRGARETTMYANEGKSGRISLFGYRDRTGSDGVLIPRAGGLDTRQVDAVISALVHMLGGAVTISSSELYQGDRTEVEISVMRDPYMLKLVNKEY